ncbi:adenosine receptor A1-like isoform X1 [Montipora foliosa]|uniref:adenosine receptor A1-like isoform X1 n=2 Tax=Montipora foliosa TaxID=591990 RepID=UPI0035F1F667
MSLSLCQSKSKIKSGERTRKKDFTVHDIEEEDKFSSMDFRTWNFVWASFIAVMAFLAAGGNMLTIIIFNEKQLRRRPHFLPISLAVADLLVGLVPIPLFITMQYNSSRLIYKIFQSADVFAGFASIFTIAVIALERMYAIGWPFRHRVLKIHTYVVAIGTPWITAFIVTVIGNLSGYIFRKTVAALLAMFISTPVVVICVAYFVLWKRERSRNLRDQLQGNEDLKLTKTVVIITAAFLLTWLPLQVITLVFHFCISCRNMSPFVMYVIKLLQYGNSVINIFIYPARNETYRKALFKKLSVFKCSCRNQRIHSSPKDMSIPVITLVPMANSTKTPASFDNFHENTKLY